MDSGATVLDSHQIPRPVDYSCILSYEKGGYPVRVTALFVRLSRLLGGCPGRGRGQIRSVRRGRLGRAREGEPCVLAGTLAVPVLDVDIAFDDATNDAYLAKLGDVASLNMSVKPTNQPFDLFTDHRRSRSINPARRVASTDS